MRLPCRTGKLGDSAERGACAARRAASCLSAVATFRGGPGARRSGATAQGEQRSGASCCSAACIRSPPRAAIVLASLAVSPPSRCATCSARTDGLDVRLPRARAHAAADHVEHGLARAGDAQRLDVEQPRLDHDRPLARVPQSRRDRVRRGPVREPCQVIDRAPTHHLRVVVERADHRRPHGSPVRDRVERGCPDQGPGVTAKHRDEPLHVRLARRQDVHRRDADARVAVFERRARDREIALPERPQRDLAEHPLVGAPHHVREPRVDRRSLLGVLGERGLLADPGVDRRDRRCQAPSIGEVGRCDPRARRDPQREPARRLVLRQPERDRRARPHRSVRLPLLDGRHVLGATDRERARDRGAQPGALAAARPRGRREQRRRIELPLRVGEPPGRLFARTARLGRDAHEARPTRASALRQGLERRRAHGGVLVGRRALEERERRLVPGARRAARHPGRALAPALAEPLPRAVERADGRLAQPRQQLGRRGRLPRRRARTRRRAPRCHRRSRARCRPRPPRARCATPPRLPGPRAPPRSTTTTAARAARPRPSPPVRGPGA